MAVKQVAWNINTKVALVQNDGAVIPGGSVLAGKFNHDVGDVLSPDLTSHVLYHHVQEVMYHIGWLNMQEVSIQVDDTPVGP